MATERFQGKYRGIKESAQVLATIKKSIGKDWKVVGEGFYWVGGIAYSGDLPACRILLAAGVPSLLQKGMGAHSAEGWVQRDGCDAFAMLAKYGDDVIRKELVEGGGGQAVVTAMRKHMGDGEVQRWGCYALYHFMRVGENIATLRGIKGIEDVLMKAIEKYHDMMFIDEEGTLVGLEDSCKAMLQALAGVVVAGLVSVRAPRPSVIIPPPKSPGVSRPSMSSLSSRSPRTPRLPLQIYSTADAMRKEAEEWRKKAQALEDMADELMKI